MKAKVQYNDFIGTAAADISDYSNLNDFLAKRGIDTQRYEAVGASFHSGYSNSFFASIICLDKEQSTDNQPFLVDIGFEADFSKEEFFDLFKRFKITILGKHSKYHEYELNDEFTFDDRESNG